MNKLCYLIEQMNMGNNVEWKKDAETCAIYLCKM